MRINLDGAILSALTRIFDALAVTVLFVLCCLPVFTIGAALSAMYAAMIAIAGDDCTSPVRCFCDAFRSNFRQATVLWALAAVTGVIVAADIVACWGFEMEATMVLSVMRGLTVFATILYICLCVYVFSGIAVYQVTWKQAIANALFWTVKKVPETLGIILLCAAEVLSVVVLWFFALPVIALCLYLQGKLLRRVFELKVTPVHYEEEIDYT